MSFSAVRERAHDASVTKVMDGNLARLMNADDVVVQR
jgi:hypothetical protein